MPAFISQALKDKPITVFGDGRQTRSFCYVSDLIEGIYRLMMSRLRPAGEHRQSRRTHRARIRKKIIRATGSRSKIVFKPLPQDDPKQRQPDIARARKILRWEPKIPLDQGLKETIAYFQKKDRLKRKTT